MPIITKRLEASPPPHLLVFLKAPRPGSVKTRLARDLGDEEATRIYRGLVERQLTNIPSNWIVEIRFAPDEAEVEMRSWLGNQYLYRAQGYGDLGARLTHAFDDAFQNGSLAVVAIGGDCPELDAACLRKAEDSLRRVDLILGPASDGGYYLIGLRKPAPRLFQGIPWSSESVLAITLARGAEANLSTELLEEKEDVDDLSSWKRFQERERVTSTNRLPRANENSLTIVVPALNEASQIRATLLTAIARFPQARVLVVDGGSADETVAHAKEAGAEVLASTRGRGVQCAAGAQAATTEWLLFLHADTQLPENAHDVVTRFIGDSTADVATFRLRFDSPGWFLRVSSFLTRFDSVFTRFGDQGILMRSSFYHALGGFPAWPLFEDVRLLQLARRQTKIYSLPAYVTTSARRFQKRGPVRQQWLNTRLLLRYLWGASPEVLATRYRNHEASKSE